MAAIVYAGDVHAIGLLLTMCALPSCSRGRTIAELCIEGAAPVVDGFQLAMIEFCPSSIGSRSSLPSLKRSQDRS